MHSFTIISKKAYENNWCWNLNCTTCGCADILNEFSILLGQDVKLNRYSQNNDIQIQKKLLEKFKDLNIKELIEQSHFPDYLGHIGLLLSACSEAEKKYKIITENILKQFLELSENTPIHHRKIKKILELGRHIEVKDLETFESLLTEKQLII